MSITPEMIAALTTLRNFTERVADCKSIVGLHEAVQAFNALDNADFFTAIDEAANEVETAAQFAAVDPEEWGDTTRADMARHQEG